MARKKNPAPFGRIVSSLPDMTKPCRDRTNMVEPGSAECLRCAAVMGEACRFKPTSLTYSPAIRLYAAMRDMPLADAAVAVASFLDPVNNTAARLAACHREMVREDVAPLVEALREIALTENCMEGENLTAELIENAHDEMITKARKTLEQWEKNNAT